MCWGSTYDYLVRCAEQPVDRSAYLNVWSSADDVDSCGRYTPSPNEPGTFTAVSVSFSNRFACGLSSTQAAYCWRSDTVFHPPIDPIGEFTTISAGGGFGTDGYEPHSCGLKTDATVECWGGNTYGQTDAPADTFTQVTAGSSHTCGLKTDSTIKCWGSNSSGQLDPPAVTTSLPATEGLNHAMDGLGVIAAGGNHSCGLRPDQTITCWGDSWSGRSVAPQGAFTALAVSAEAACALRADSTAECWGQANATGHPAGEFKAVTADGCGLRADSTVECWEVGWTGEPVSPAEEFIAVSNHRCGIRTDLTIACWGYADDTESHYVPDFTVPGGTFTAISVSSRAICGVRTDQTITCKAASWMNDRDKLEGVPSGSFTGVATGGSHSCGLRTNQTVTCWGANWDGQANAPGGTFAALSAGYDHTCGLRTDSTVHCWGSNESDSGRAFSGQALAPAGRFGPSDMSAIATPTATGSPTDDVPGGPRSAMEGSGVVTAGGGHSCGLTTGGSVECWGLNREGQADAPAGPFAAVSAGYYHTCGLRTSGAVECWGANSEGESKDPAGGFLAVSAGGSHTCGLRTDQTIACWGSNWVGQREAPEGAFTAVSAGLGHSCGIRTDRTVQCWGTVGFGAGQGSRTAEDPAGKFLAVSADMGSCGIRTNGAVECWDYDDWFAPDSIPSGEFTAVSAAGTRACGLRSDGTVECWGYYWGESTANPAGSFLAVAAGESHACGLREDQTIACWGSNDYGESNAPAGRFGPPSSPPD